MTDFENMLEFLRMRHEQYRHLAEHAVNATEKLAAECRELGYYDCIKAWERIAKGGAA